MARLFADEQFPQPVVNELRQLGHDVKTTQEAGLANKKTDDGMILRAASAEGRAVLTKNRRDFFKAAKAYPDHQGVVACTDNKNFRQLAHCIHEKLQPQPNLAGQEVRVYRPPAQGQGGIDQAREFSKAQAMMRGMQKQQKAATIGAKNPTEQTQFLNRAAAKSKAATPTPPQPTPKIEPHKPKKKL
jgi:predicted nuclease of predicted toxin-antitoxin system